MNALKLVDGLLENEEDIDPSELAREVPSTEIHVPATMFTLRHRLEVNFAYVLKHNYRMAIALAGMLSTSSSYARLVGDTSITNESDKSVVVVRMDYPDNMKKAARVTGAPESFLSTLNTASHLEFWVDREALYAWFRQNGYLGAVQPGERSFPIGESEPDPSELTRELQDLQYVAGMHDDTLFNYVANLPTLGMMQDVLNMLNLTHEKLVELAAKRPKYELAHPVQKASYRVSLVTNAIEKRTKDREWCKYYNIPFLGESDIDPSELASTVPDSKWKLTASETDKHGRRRLVYKHSSGVVMELINIYYDTPKFGRSMLKYWNMSVYDDEDKYVDGLMNMHAATPAKAFEDCKTWVVKLMRHHSHSLYRSLLAESDDPLDPSVLASTIPDYVNGILTVIDNGLEGDAPIPEPVRVNAVNFLRTKSHDWLKRARHMASTGFPSSVSFGTSDNEAKPWTYAVLLHAPEEFVQFCKQDGCELELEMDKQRMLDWIAAWLAKPQH